MSFIFNTGIPAANNNPSIDQPDMLANNVATDGILAVDHISFNTNFGGNHLQVHLPQYTNPAIVNGAATEGSVIYGAAGTADTAHAQTFMKNPNGTFLLSAIKVFGSFVMSSNNVTILNGINFTLSVNAAGTVATVNLTPNATTGTAIVVIPNYNNAVQTVTYTIAANTLTFTVIVPGSILSFAALQL